MTSAQILNKTKSDKLTVEQKKILEQELQKLKTSYENNIEIVELKDFDIFGGLSEDITKIKTIDNKKHREIEKDNYKVLNINKQTDLDLYIDTLRNYLNLLKEAFYKITTLQNISLYLTSNKELDTINLNIFHLNENEAVNENKLEDEIYLYKVNLKETMQVLYYSNIAFYDNTNQTLPLGMNLSDEVLVDFSKYKLVESNKEDFKINYLQDEYTSKIIKVHCIEYNVI